MLFCHQLVSCCFLLGFFVKKKIDFLKKNGNKLSGLIWVQTVCKCYQQTTLVLGNFKDTSSDIQLGYFMYASNDDSEVTPRLRRLKFTIVARFFNNIKSHVLAHYGLEA